ncbi:MAG: hypothetical protein CMD83_00375 [Gammaproteobacteria bacterium]|nr:hypothetical protein [Gammaproteobacteria bacterium]|tara:strand:- start:182 stop:526 length:345 start_codon:yes stop_codon:yes gene_type:complete
MAREPQYRPFAPAKVCRDALAQEQSMAGRLPALTGKASDFLKVGAAAAGRGDLDTIRALLGEQPDWLTRIASQDRTLLWEAADKGQVSVVEFLTNAGADINARGCHFTPLLVEL